MDRREMLMAGSSLFAANLLPEAASVATSASAPPPALRPVRAVKIRDVVIGEGRVKTIVPITGTTADEAIAQARVIGGSAQIDVVEFRVDFLDIALDAGKLAALGPKVTAQLNGKPLIVTFRTKAEGGNKTIADADYGALYATLLKAQFADLIDVEMFRSEAVVRRLVAGAHQVGAFIVMSNHDFSGTPPAGTRRRRVEAGDDAPRSERRARTAARDVGDGEPLCRAADDDDVNGRHGGRLAPGRRNLRIGDVLRHDRPCVRARPGRSRAPGGRARHRSPFVDQRMRGRPF